MRIRSVPLLVVASLMALALPVAAAPPETITTTEQNVVATFPDVVPSCGGRSGADSTTTAAP